MTNKNKVEISPTEPEPLGYILTLLYKNSEDNKSKDIGLALSTPEVTKFINQWKLNHDHSQVTVKLYSYEAQIDLNLSNYSNYYLVPFYTEDNIMKGTKTLCIDEHGNINIDSKNTGHSTKFIRKQGEQKMNKSKANMQQQITELQSKYEEKIDKLKSVIKMGIDDQRVMWDIASVENGLMCASEALRMTGDAVDNDTKESIMVSIMEHLEDAIDLSVSTSDISTFYGNKIGIDKTENGYKLRALEQGEQNEI